MPKLFLHNVIRVLLITVTLLNAPLYSTALAQAKEQPKAITSSSDRGKELKHDSFRERPSDDLFQNVENKQRTSTQFEASPVFIENIGQFDQRVRFQAQIGNATVHFLDDSIWFTLLETTPPDLQTDPAQFIFPQPRSVAEGQQKGVHIKMDLPGANNHPDIQPFGEITTHYSFFGGENISDFRSDVPVWQGIRYVDIYPGMNLDIQSNGEHVVWGFSITDPGLFYEKNEDLVLQGLRLHIAGQKKLNSKADELEVNTEVGSFILPEISLNGMQVLPEVENNQIVVPVPTQISSLPVAGSNFHTASYGLEALRPAAENSTQALPNNYPAGMVAPTDALLYSTYITNGASSK